ncbi:hypothetical protein, partial [Methylacidimicrobium cyclopophantes]|uniref:hypothetical protein n=1 Tax=Methylacidimicrobium cyclopophantes TaxID=1041766 RepID=UPI00115C2387
MRNLYSNALVSLLFLGCPLALPQMRAADAGMPQASDSWIGSASPEGADQSTALRGDPASWDAAPVAPSSGPSSVYGASAPGSDLADIQPLLAANSPGQQPSSEDLDETTTPVKRGGVIRMPTTNVTADIDNPLLEPPTDLVPGASQAPTQEELFRSGLTTRVIDKNIAASAGP